MNTNCVSKKSLRKKGTVGEISFVDEIRFKISLILYNYDIKPTKINLFS